MTDGHFCAIVVTGSHNKKEPLVNTSSLPTEAILLALEQVRDSGVTNMLNIREVQRCAYELELYDLVTWLEDNRRDTKLIFLALNSLHKLPQSSDQ